MPAEFSKAQLYEQAFREGAKAGLPFAAIKQATQETLLNEAEIHHLGRVSGREQYRKAEVPEVANSHTPREVTHEKELREFLGRIIETTPELKLAAFLPEPEEPSPTPEQRRDSALSPLNGPLAQNAQVGTALS